MLGPRPRRAPGQTVGRGGQDRVLWGGVLGRTLQPSTGRSQMQDCPPSQPPAVSVQPWSWPLPGPGGRYKPFRKKADSAPGFAGHQSAPTTYLC